PPTLCPASRLAANTRTVQQRAACWPWVGPVADAYKWAVLCREDFPLAGPASALEERDHHGRQRRCAADVVVREPRQDRELRLRSPRTIPAAIALSAAEQPEHLDGVGRREDIGVRRDDERRRLKRSELLGEVVSVPHP